MGTHSKRLLWNFTHTLVRTCTHTAVCVCALRKQFNHFYSLSITPHRRKKNPFSRTFFHQGSSHVQLHQNPQFEIIKKHDMNFIIFWYFFLFEPTKMSEKVRRNNKERILIPTPLDVIWNLRREKIMHTSRQFQQDLNEYFDVPVLVVSVCVACLRGSTYRVVLA